MSLGSTLIVAYAAIGLVVFLWYWMTDYGLYDDVAEKLAHAILTGVFWPIVPLIAIEGVVE